MDLSSGARIGPYEIIDALGAGGMGEVFRARDTQLGREVAIKIVPEVFAADPDRRARFQREAQVLASLNHPGIAAIYGGEPPGQAIVLELAEGPTLADRLALGPLPLDEARLIAKQIADALEAAHGQGIVHRDLKPANIKLRPDGVVKDGGARPTWSPTRRELYYIMSEQVMVVPTPWRGTRSPSRSRGSGLKKGSGCAAEGRGLCGAWICTRRRALRARGRSGHAHRRQTRPRHGDLEFLRRAAADCAGGEAMMQPPIVTRRWDAERKKLIRDGGVRT